MQSRKKIMLIIPEMTMGGAQRSLSKLSIELAKFLDVSVVVFNDPNDIAYPVGGRVISLDIQTGDSLIAKTNAFRKRVNKLRELKKELGIDVAVSFLEGADYINVLSRGNERIIISVRGSKLHDENMLNYFYWLRSGFLIPWLYRKADAIVSVNGGIARELKDHHGIPENKVMTIGNFYDHESILRLSHEPKESPIAQLYDKKILITTGRLSREKGLESLITVFSALRKKRNDIRFFLVGDGPEKEKLIQRCRQEALVVSDDATDLERSPDVVFLGARSNVFKYLEGSSIYVMNSLSEGFPNGLVEAMICGLPVMSSNCPYGPAEILDPGHQADFSNVKPRIAMHGILMPIASDSVSIGLWVKTLSDALDNESLLADLSSSAQQRVRDFDTDHVMEQWLKVINA
jgi:glycosyltransferase involved in cell wall biosynthesis